MAKGASAAKAVKEIRRKTRRRLSAEEKVRIVLEGLRGEANIYPASSARAERPNGAYAQAGTENTSPIRAPARSRRVAALIVSLHPRCNPRSVILSLRCASRRDFLRALQVDCLIGGFSPRVLSGSRSGFSAFPRRSKARLSCLGNTFLPDWISLPF